VATTEDERKAEALIRDLELLGGTKCGGCGGALGPHAYVASVALGFKDRPRCAGCLADALGREKPAFLEHLGYYIRSRACFRAGWEWASRHVGHDGEPEPGARWLAEESMGGEDATWDAGDMGCGDLVLELRLRLKTLRPGQVLKVTATDPGAPEDMPAWCGLTANPLVAMKPPHYWIRRKEEK
jgi:tRNA 2-thiouridine synthesizing protein A